MKSAPPERRMVNVKSTSSTNEERLQQVLNVENIYIDSKKRHIDHLIVTRVFPNARSQRPDAKKHGSRQNTIPTKGKKSTRKHGVKSSAISMPSNDTAVSFSEMLDVLPKKIVIGAGKWCNYGQRVKRNNQFVKHFYVYTGEVLMKMSLFTNGVLLDRIHPTTPLLAHRTSVVTEGLTRTTECGL